MIKAVDALSKPTAKALNQVTQKTKKTVGGINSYEFHLGFVPTHRPGTHKPTTDKIEHFIDQIV